MNKNKTKNVQIFKYPRDCSMKFSVVEIAVIAIISDFTCKRGERVNSALFDPFASFVCTSKRKNI